MDANAQGQVGDDDREQCRGDQHEDALEVDTADIFPDLLVAEFTTVWRLREALCPSAIRAKAQSLKDAAAGLLRLIRTPKEQNNTQKECPGAVLPRPPVTRSQQQKLGKKQQAARTQPTSTRESEAYKAISPATAQQAAAMLPCIAPSHQQAAMAEQNAAATAGLVHMRALNADQTPGIGAAFSSIAAGQGSAFINHWDGLHRHKVAASGGAVPGACASYWEHSSAWAAGYHPLLVGSMLGSQLVTTGANTPQVSCVSAGAQPFGLSRCSASSAALQHKAADVSDPAVSTGKQEPAARCISNDPLGASHNAALGLKAPRLKIHQLVAPAAATARPCATHGLFGSGGAGRPGNRLNWPTKGDNVPAGKWASGLFERFPLPSTGPGSLANIEEDLIQTVLQLKRLGYLQLEPAELTQTQSGAACFSQVVVLGKRKATLAPLEYQQQRSAALGSSYGRCILSLGELGSVQVAASACTGPAVFRVVLLHQPGITRNMLAYVQAITALAILMQQSVGAGGPLEPDWAAVGLAHVAPSSRRVVLLAAVDNTENHTAAQQQQPAANSTAGADNAVVASTSQRDIAAAADSHGALKPSAKAGEQALRRLHPLTGLLMPASRNACNSGSRKKMLQLSSNSIDSAAVVAAAGSHSPGSKGWGSPAVIEQALTGGSTLQQSSTLCQAKALTSSLAAAQHDAAIGLPMVNACDPHSMGVANTGTSSQQQIDTVVSAAGTKPGSDLMSQLPAVELQQQFLVQLQGAAHCAGKLAAHVAVAVPGVHAASSAAAAVVNTSVAQVGTTTLESVLLPSVCDASAPASGARKHSVMPGAGLSNAAFWALQNRLTPAVKKHNMQSQLQQVPLQPAADAASSQGIQAASASETRVVQLISHTSGTVAASNIGAPGIAEVEGSAHTAAQHNTVVNRKPAEAPYEFEPGHPTMKDVSVVNEPAAAAVAVEPATTQVAQAVHTPVNKWPKGDPLPASHWLNGVQVAFPHMTQPNCKGSNNSLGASSKKCLRCLIKQGTLALGNKEVLHSKKGLADTSRMVVLNMAKQLQVIDPATYEQQQKAAMNAEPVTFAALEAAAMPSTTEQTTTTHLSPPHSMYKVQVPHQPDCSPQLVDYMLEVLILGSVMARLVGIGHPMEPDWTAAGLQHVRPCAPAGRADACSGSTGSTLMHEDLRLALSTAQQAT